MTTYTRSELATRSLRKAGVVAIDVTPTASELLDAETLILADVATLAAESIWIWNGSDQSVPQEYLEPLSDYFAITLKEDNGLIGTVEAEQARALKRSRLRRISAKPATGEPVVSDYY